MINYGIVYGLSDYGLADRLNIAREEAKGFIDAYLERFSRGRRVHPDHDRAAREQGYVTTLFGRRRQIPELRARNWQVRSLGERLAVNTVIQGTAADVMKLAMIGCHRALADSALTTRMILTIHDELLFEGPPDEADAVRDLVEREMLAPWEDRATAAGGRRRRRADLARGEVAFLLYTNSGGAMSRYRRNDQRHERRAAHQREHPGHRRVGVHAPDRPLHVQQPRVGPPALVAERGVARERLLARLAAVEHEAQLAPAGKAEVEGGADPLGRRRQAVPGAVAGEEHPVLGGCAHLVGDPVALVALGGDVEVPGEAHRRLLDVVARVERADADAHLVARGEAPRVPRTYVPRVEPQLEVLAVAVRVDLQAARQPRVGRLDRVRRRGQHPPPPERVDDQRRRELAAVGLDREALAILDRRGRRTRHRGDCARRSAHSSR